MLFVSLCHFAYDWKRKEFPFLTKRRVHYTLDSNDYFLRLGISTDEFGVKLLLHPKL